MTSTLSDSPAVAAWFDRVCDAIASQRRGFTLGDLSGARAIAIEMEADEPDRGKLNHLAQDLEIDLDELEHDCARSSEISWTSVGGAQLHGAEPR